jgi:hypothetical protein
MTLSKEDQDGAAASPGESAPENMPKQPKEGDLKEADLISGPNIEDAESNDAPVRTNRPDVPIIQTLKVGAGAHKPNTDEDFDSDGRFAPDQPETPEAPAQPEPTKPKG